MSRSILSMVALAGALVAGHALAAPPSEASLLAQARVTREQATRVALQRVHGGKVQSAELEREHGRLVWSFDLARGGHAGVTEVQVDAQTGAIVSIQQESAAHEAAESRADARGR